MGVQCVMDQRMGRTYSVARGQGRALPVNLCDLCAESLPFGEVVRIARSLHMRPAASLKPTTLEAIEAAKRARTGKTGPRGQVAP